MENSLTNSPAPNSRGNNPPLPDSFYLRPCLLVARDLLGKVLVCRKKGVEMQVRLEEVEAYLGDEDPASHAYRKVTPRNAAMYERGGACYVYLSYGMYFCMNVVAGPQGVGHAVLLRAGEPLKGLPQMRRNRGLEPDSDPRLICSGPGKLAQALGIDLSDYGRRYDEPSFKIVDTGVNHSHDQILAGPRIGISKAKDFPFRLSVKGSRWLSRKA